jgi:hypothetical protein
MSPITAIIVAAVTTSTPGDRHQPADLRRVERDLRDLSVEQLALLEREVESAQVGVDRLALVGGQLERVKPGTPALAEQVGGRNLRGQVALQGGVDVALEPARVAHQLRAPRRQAAQQPRALVGHPHPRQQVRRQQLRQSAGIDLVVLDLGLVDRPQLARVGDHHLGHVRFEDARDRQAVAGRLERHLVVLAEALGEQLQLRARRLHPPPGAGLAAV